MKTSRLICLIILSGLLFGACMPNSATTPSGTAVWPTAIPGTPTSAVKNLLTPDPSSDRLNDLGPWLLMSTDKGLWAANPNGSGLKQLLAGNLTNNRLQDGVQPGGNLLAVITSDGGFHHMVLKLLSLPDGTLTPITPLTPEQAENPAGSAPGEPLFEAQRAIGEMPSLAWSPDGQKLAFTGSMDGANAELYLYKRSDGKIQRLTHDTSQDYGPSWAPDGGHILFLSADRFGTGAESSATGVWSIAADGSGVKYLYQSQSAGEKVHGWVDGNTALISSLSPGCGSVQLRLYNLANEQIRILQRDCFSDAAIGPQGNILFGSSQGLYIYPRDGRMATLVTAGNVTRLYKDPSTSLFVARFEDGRQISVDGEGKNLQTSPLDAIDNVSSNGLVWAWTSSGDTQPGVWISRPGLPAQQIFTQKAAHPIWDGSNYLLFFSGSRLYQAGFPDYSQIAPAATLDASVADYLWMGGIQ